jgi:hypothetical protein
VKCFTLAQTRLRMGCRPKLRTLSTHAQSLADEAHRHAPSLTSKAVGNETIVDGPGDRQRTRPVLAR